MFINKSMQKTYYTIYKITNQINGKIYIGSHKTKDLNDSYMGSGKYLRYAQKKNGLENFTKEILFIFDTPEEMYDKEAELVNEEFISTKNTYNIKKGGYGGFDYVNSTERNLYGKNGHVGYGGENLTKGWNRIRSQKEFDKISNTLKDAYASGRIINKFKGKQHTAATKKIIGEKSSINQSGEKNSQFGTCWITNGKECLKINKDDVIPKGYYKGRKIKF